MMTPTKFWTLRAGALLLTSYHLQFGTSSIVYYVLAAGSEHRPQCLQGGHVHDIFQHFMLISNFARERPFRILLDEEFATMFAAR